MRRLISNNKNLISNGKLLVTGDIPPTPNEIVFSDLYLEYRPGFWPDGCFLYWSWQVELKNPTSGYSKLIHTMHGILENPQDFWVGNDFTLSEATPIRYFSEQFRGLGNLDSFVVGLNTVQIWEGYDMFQKDILRLEDSIFIIDPKK
jgi:hypothetical protein